MTVRSADFESEKFPAPDMEILRYAPKIHHFRQCLRLS